MISLVNHDSRARENSEVVIIYPDIYIYIYYIIYIIYIYIYYIYIIYIIYIYIYYILYILHDLHKIIRIHPIPRGPTRRRISDLSTETATERDGFDRNIRNPKPAKGEVLPSMVI